jgi:competence protein ComEC
MARHRRKNRKKEKISSVFFTLLAMAAAFAILVTLNSTLHFSNALPSWQQIRTEFESYLKDSRYETQPVSGTAKVHFIDVGQGQCTLIQADGSTVLIDAGENDQGEKVVSYLKSQGVTQIDYAVGSHPHSDHIGGLDVVIDAIPTQNIILPKLQEEIIPTTKTYLDLLDAIERNHVQVITAKVGEEYPLKGGCIRVLGPSGNFKDLNSMSVGIKFTYGERSFLTTGDMEQEAEEALLQTGENLKADIYALGHHGSKTSNSMDLLRKVQAKYYIAQMGYRNEYGHPHKEVLERVKKLGGTFLRSDQDGTVVFTTDGKSLEYTKEK